MNVPLAKIGKVVLRRNGRNFPLHKIEYLS